MTWVFAIGRKGLMFPEEMLCRRLAQGHTDVCGVDNVWRSAVLRERAGVLVLERAGSLMLLQQQHASCHSACLPGTYPTCTDNELQCFALYCIIL